MSKDLMRECCNLTKKTKTYFKLWLLVMLILGGLSFYWVYITIKLVGELK